MLQLKTIHPEAFELLHSISAHYKLNDFSLAGGTALALQLGHRISLDLDFFTSNLFDSANLLEQLRSSYTINSCSQSTNSLTLFIQTATENIKVDFIRHNYPLLQAIQSVDNIRIFSLEDIAAMKLNAIANRGAKKDFFDIHALLNTFSIQQLLHHFEKKYDHINSFTVIKSLVYFLDADLEPEPVSLEDITWNQVKKDIIAYTQQI